MGTDWIVGKLTALQVKHAKPGTHGDGDGLYLRVKPSGARSWVLRVQHAGKRQDIGLGSIADLSLSEARDKAAQLRKLARKGADAIAERDRERVIVPTFEKAVIAAHAEFSKGWTDKAGDAFLSSLKTHAYPALGRLRVNEIASANVIAALAPIWTEKPQQARKVRHRILQVLSFAKAMGWRGEAAPGADELRRGLAKQPESKNFAAVPFGEVPALVAGELGKAETSARLALLFVILTGARSGEVRGARWEQFDLEAAIWARPAELMKSRKAHDVTLNQAALSVLAKAGQLSDCKGLVFPGARVSSALSDMSIAKVLRAAGRTETVHGFRSSFRDWAAEKRPDIPPMVAEIALAHVPGNKVEAAYLRTDMRALRFKLAEAWGAFVAPSLGAAKGNVVKLGTR